MTPDTTAQCPAETVDCLCGESRTIGPPIRARDGMTGRLCAYVRCARCGIERCSPRPVAAVMGSFYPTSYPAYAVRAESLTVRIARLVFATFWADDNRLGALRRLL